MSEALYSKYRPKVFTDLVGQKFILQTLENAITSNKISHAYMFCGPRGTGKTTMARLLSKACMCSQATDSMQPSVKFCGTCKDCVDISKGEHPDVYELDAASRTGVENVREEIINRVGFSATRGNKKIYIIDEVHMLSTAAFNALLKTLEEPPEHVIFILCTTDPQKVPETILSRCQRFDFKAISEEDIFERLKYVCEQEKVTADDNALKVIAHSANGAMRNALTSLEQAIAYANGNITSEVISETQQSSSDINFVSLIENIGIRNLPGVFEWIETFCQKGADFNSLNALLLELIRNMYIVSAGVNVDVSLSEDIQNLLSLFTTERLHRFMLILSDLSSEIKSSTNLRLTFEIAMSKVCFPKSDLTLESLAERISCLENNVSPTNIQHNVVSSSSKAIDNNVNTNNDSDLQSSKDETLSNTKNSTPVETSINKNNTDESTTKINSPHEDALQESKEDNSNLENTQNIKINGNSIPHEDSSDKVEDVTNPADQNTVQIPNLKMPPRAVPYNFNDTRKNLREQANLNTNSTQNSNTNVDLSDKNKLQKLWNSAFMEIRKKYPAYGAILLTANADYDYDNHKFILNFPTSASFSVGVLKKPECMEKIFSEIKKIMGNNIALDIRVDKNSGNEEFNPEFVNEFREEASRESNENLNSSNVNNSNQSPYGNELNSNLNYSANNMPNSNNNIGQATVTNNNTLNNNFNNANYSPQPTNYNYNSTASGLGEIADNSASDFEDADIPADPMQASPTSGNDIRDMLNNLGAFNITEE